MLYYLVKLQIWWYVIGFCLHPACQTGGGNNLMMLKEEEMEEKEGEGEPRGSEQQQVAEFTKLTGP